MGWLRFSEAGRKIDWGTGWVELEQMGEGCRLLMDLGRPWLNRGWLLMQIYLDQLEPIFALVSSWHRLEFEAWPSLLNEVQSHFEKNAGKGLPQVLLCRIGFLKEALLFPAVKSGDEKVIGGLACLMSEIGQAVGIFLHFMYCLLYFCHVNFCYVLETFIILTMKLILDLFFLFYLTIWFLITCPFVCLASFLIVEANNEALELGDALLSCVAFPSEDWEIVDSYLALVAMLLSMRQLEECIMNLW